MAVVFSDNFNRADGDPGSNWTAYFTAFTITSNQLVHTANDSNQLEYTGTGSTLANCAVSVKHFTSSSNPGGVTARRAGVTDTFYLWKIFSDGGWDFIRKVTGTPTTVQTGGAGSITVVSGSVIKLTVTGTGATVTCVMNYNGTDISTYSDTAGNRITVAGVVGIYGFPASGGIYDDFVLDDTTAGGRTAKNTRASNLGVERGVNLWGEL